MEGASYLPAAFNQETAVTDDEEEIKTYYNQQKSTGKEKGPAISNEHFDPREKDPLYAALLGGKIGEAIGGAEREKELNTLDESISATIVPQSHLISNINQLRNETLSPRLLSVIVSTIDTSSSSKVINRHLGDLWGPLVNSLLLATCFGLASHTSPVATFTFTFSYFWLGTAIAILNAKLLGYRMATLPSMSFLGYCFGPLMVAASLWTLFPARVLLVKWILTVCGGLWSGVAALRLLDVDLALEDRRTLAALPIVLHYLVVSWTFLTCP